MLPLFYDSTFSRSLSHDNLCTDTFSRAKNCRTVSEENSLSRFFPSWKKEKQEKHFARDPKRLHAVRTASKKSKSF